MIVTGDLVHEPSPKAYHRLAEQLTRLSCPVYCLPGNHDNPEMMSEHLNVKNISTKKQIDFTHWQVLLLDSHKPGSHGGHIAEHEMQFLRTSIEQHPQQDVLVAVHHPCISIHSPWMDNMMIDNATVLQSQLERYPQVKSVIFGHVHQEFEAVHNDILYQTCPSTCVQFKPQSNHYEKDTLAPGFRQLTLKADGHLQSQVIRLA